MFDQKHYVPVLKWKRGEQIALKQLDASSRESLTPLIELVPVPYDYVNERPAKSIDDHLNGIGEELLNAWGEKRPVFIDPYWIDQSERMSNGLHPFYFILEDIRRNKMKAIPVTGTSRDKDYQQEVIKAHKKDGLGVCLRLEDEDFLDVKGAIIDLIKLLKVTPAETDIIIDLRSISTNDDSKNAIFALTLLKDLPSIMDWRTLTICASAFPETLSEIPANSIGIIPRSEWGVWKILKGKEHLFKRMPTFGDYAIAHPEYVDIDPRIMRMSGNIRYTTENSWLVVKGVQVKKNTWDQMHGLSAQLVNHPSFCGKGFSWGDEYVFNCSNRDCSSGNAETWRRVGTNHHLTYVTKQISNFFSS
ncbi:hypothetical protein BR63_05835 [Thermanaerosceptrum fracticalcis]|uniref:Beta protein n=1 Tax=Thermanaerosceptrum fracticalcis TaxID=1712410 RepID=A0A7G6E1C5_THEFR|nr:beta family protein [Thermanaerosceptrum fracticalcis]QNB45879.1 hypothetical protein BR63_05835 [Thermanaerosceptrum fracticalcis]